METVIFRNRQCKEYAKLVYIDKLDMTFRYDPKQTYTDKDIYITYYCKNKTKDMIDNFKFKDPVKGCKEIDKMKKSIKNIDRKLIDYLKRVHNSLVKERV